MAIAAGDIKLVASQIMNDVPEGGGAPSATIINDATTNTIFPDISELDRAIGRVNLRKVHVTVRTPDTDGYYGVNVIVADPFADPRVSATLFTTNDVFDRRENASSRMEAYLSMGATYAGLLFGNHLEGQSVVTILQRTDAVVPVVGQTIVLLKNIGLSDEFAQYVRITGVTVTTRTFTDALGDFSRNQVVCDISDQLQQDFTGFNAERVDTTISYAGKTRLHETVVADAARYYGVVPLEEAVAIGDFTVQAESIFTQLVPSTRIEVPIADARMNQRLTPQIATSANISRSITTTFNSTSAMYIGGSIAIGTLSVSLSGTTVTDKGGLLVNGSTQVGTVDYANGVLTLSTNVFGAGTGTYTVAYTAAATPTLVNRSRADSINATNQRLSYVTTLDPVPVAGSLTVSFRTLGRWYVLKDDGSGALRGSDSSAGAGTLNSTTGTVSVTLGALPDIGTAVVYTWGTPTKIRAVPPPTGSTGGTANPTPPSTAVNNALGRTLTFGTRRPIKPGTVLITWNDGTARTATDNSVRGLSGAAIGTVDYSQGKVYWQPTVLPPKGTVVTMSIGEVSSVSLSVQTLTNGGTTWTHTFGAVQPNTFRAEMSFRFDIPGAQPFNTSGENRRAFIYDNGSGSLVFKSQGNEYVIGTITYATGAVVVQKSVASVLVEYLSYTATSVLDTARTVSARTVQFNLGQIELVSYTNSTADTSQNVNLTVDYLEYQLTYQYFSGGYLTGDEPYLKEFTLSGNRYVVVGDQVRVNVNPATGVGTAAGTYANGVAQITEWGSITTPTVSGVGAVVAPASPLYDAEVGNSTFRTAVSPLVNGGFNLAGNWIDGTAFSVTADSSGFCATGSAAVSETVDGSRGVFAYVDYESGIATVYFGRRTLRNPVSDPLIFDITSLGIPGVTTVAVEPVAADTLRYNAVGYSYLPLDPDILGLDPVRLPADGRVPIFRPGTVAVLGHTGQVGPVTVTNGQTLNAGRTRLSRVRIIGADNQIISTGYTADLDAGTVTFTSVTGYSQPIRFEHRIEDTMLVSDAQISGQLSFTRPSTHVYPVPGSYVSSALVAGDVQARVTPAFDQVTWTGVWSDSAIGSPATGSYNDTLHPITTTNLGALTERWALIFTNTTSFNIVGEHVGVIGAGSTGADCAPMNPATGQPYFTLQSEGWGLGWSTGNVVRFNTVGAIVPIWVARTILQGPETVVEDDFTILSRGDVNRP